MNCDNCRKEITPGEKFYTGKAPFPDTGMGETLCEKCAIESGKTPGLELEGEARFILVIGRYEQGHYCGKCCCKKYDRNCPDPDYMEC
jgi:hypothetical protein